MSKWADFEELLGREGARAVDLGLMIVRKCAACGGSGMTQPDRGPVPCLADNECVVCDGFGRVAWLFRGGGGGRGDRAGTEGSMVSVAKIISQGIEEILGGSKGGSKVAAPKSQKIFRVKKGAPAPAGRAAKSRAVQVGKSKKARPEAALRRQDQ